MKETPVASEPPKPYKAFISYSHAADGLLAPVLQSALQSFAKPWYKFRAVRVFRDRTNLSVKPDLWGSIEEAVRGSEFFLLMASPEAARSGWVSREVEAFLDGNAGGRLIIVLTGGTLVWDDAANDFVEDERSAFPRLGRKVFEREPKWEDLSWASGEEHLSLRNPAFRDVVASISSTIRKIPLDEITGHDVVEHRRTKRVVRLVVAALVSLLACVAAAALVAYRQARVADARRIAAEAALFSSREPHLLGVSALLAAESLNRYPSIEAQETLAAALQLLPRSAAVLRSRGPVTALAFTPDGKHLVTGSYDGRLVVSKAEGGEVVVERDFDSNFEAISLSPDGLSVAAVNPEGEVTVWRWADNTAAPPLKPELSVTAHALSRDGRYLAAAGGGAVYVYDLGSRTRVATIITESAGGVTAVGFSGGNEYLAVGKDSGEILLWSLSDPTSPRPAQPLEQSGEARGAVSKIVFDKAVRHVACATYRHSFYQHSLSQHSIYVWNVADGKQVGKSTMDSQLDGIAFNAEGDFLAAWGADAAIHLWSVPEGVAERVQLVGGGRVNAVAFLPDSGTDSERYVATASNDGTARLWDYSVSSTRRVSRERMRVAHEGWVEAVALSPDGNLIATAGGNEVRVWYLRDTPSLVQFRPPRGRSLSVAFRDGQDALLTACDDGRLYTWSLGGVRVGEWPAEAPPRQSPPQKVALSPDGSRIATVRGNMLIIYDTSPGKEVVRKELEGGVERLSFGYDGHYLAVSYVRRVSAWEAQFFVRVYEVSTIKGPWFDPEASVYGLAVSPKGRYVARLVEWFPQGRRLGAPLSRVIVKDLFGNNRPDVLDKQSDAPVSATAFAVAFSRDESLVAVGVGNAIELYELPSGRRVASMGMRHRDTVDAIAFSADGKYLASAAHDATLRVWSVPGGEESSRTRMPEAASQVVFGKGDKYLATFAEGGAARVWLWQPKDLLAEAGARLPANLSREDWRRYVGEESYNKTFPDHPVPDE